MLANATIADVLRPFERKYAAFYDIALIIGGSVFVGLCAQVTIWLPFSPVPITGQTFAVLMIGALLGAWRGCFSIIVYLIEGLAGLPVFAAGQAGLAVLIGPRGGYLVGFVFAAFITGLLAERGWDRRVGSTILAMVFGNLALYACGIFWLFCLTGLDRTVFVMGIYAFIPGDLLKIALAAILLPSAWRLLGYSDLIDRSE